MRTSTSNGAKVRVAAAHENKKVPIEHNLIKFMWKELNFYSRRLREGGNIRAAFTDPSVRNFNLQAADGAAAARNTHNLHT